MKKFILKVEKFIIEFKMLMISYGEVIIKVKGN